MGAKQSSVGRARGVTTRASDGSDMNLSDGCKGAPVADGVKLPIVCGEEVMSAKAHGTTEKPVQENLRWNCEWKTADKICSFNRHYAEYAGYWVGHRAAVIFTKGIENCQKLCTL